MVDPENGMFREEAGNVPVDLLRALEISPDRLFQNDSALLCDQILGIERFCGLSVEVRGCGDIKYAKAGGT